MSKVDDVMVPHRVRIESVDKIDAELKRCPRQAHAAARDRPVAVSLNANSTGGEET